MAPPPCVLCVSGCMSAGRGAVVSVLAVRTVWSSAVSGSASRFFTHRAAAGGCVAVTTWTAERSCAFTQVSAITVTIGVANRVGRVELMSVVVPPSPGVLLQRIQTPAEAPPPKLTRADLPSDDEVEVVTEWLAPPVLEGWSNQTPPTSVATPPLHVPVIQRPPEPNANNNASDGHKVNDTDFI